VRTGVLRAPLLIGLAAALAACAPAEPPPQAAASAAPVAATPSPAQPAKPAPAAAAADLAHVGALRIGAAFGKAPGDKAFVSAGMREAMEGDCEYYDQGTLPQGMSMMVIADRIARFEVDAVDDPGQRVTAPPADAAALPYGLWVGMTVAEARQRLPAGVVTTAHAYNAPDGNYLTWTDKAAKLALRLETLNGLVTSIYWGQPDAVELIEGCA